MGKFSFIRIFNHVFTWSTFLSTEVGAAPPEYWSSGIRIGDEADGTPSRRLDHGGLNHNVKVFHLLRRQFAYWQDHLFIVK